MKVQELVAGSKSPSPLPQSRGAKADSADVKSFDFAGALAEARKKPEANRADASAETKKPAASAKKAKAPKKQNDCAPDDTSPADAEVAQSDPLAEADPEQPVAE